MKTNRLIVFLCLALSVAIGCKKDKTVELPPVQSDVVVSGLSVIKGPGLTPVVITGSGFSTTIANNKVTFNGVVAIVTSATATSLTVTVPLKAGPGPVKVQVGEKIGVGPNYDYEYTYLVSTVAGSPANFGYKDGQGGLARFSNNSFGLKIAPDGNLYFADIKNQRIRKITPDGLVSTFAGNGIEGLKDGAVLSAQFSLPYDLTKGLNGVFYVADLGNSKIRKIENGVVSTFAGSSEGYLDGQGTTAKFGLPRCIETDALGNNIYVADVENNNIRKITKDGLVTTLAGKNFGYADGQGMEAKFGGEFYGMVLDSKGNIYVSDPNNQCIRKITPSGLVTTYFGAKGESVLINGPLSSARAKLLGSLAIDGSDNIYFSDGYFIRKISSDGIVSTIAGSGQLGSIDGPALQASFNSISSLHSTSDGSIIYIDDSGLGTIRKIERQ